MISDKKFTPEEYHKLITDFAQEFANRVTKIMPGVKVQLRQESTAHYLLMAHKPNGNTEAYQLFLNTSGEVETYSVYGH